jgi:hypothetical protein
MFFPFRAHHGHEQIIGLYILYEEGMAISLRALVIVFIVITAAEGRRGTNTGCVFNLVKNIVRVFEKL